MSEVSLRTCPPSWQLATVEDVAHVVRGVTYKKEDARSIASPGLVPVLRATNITGSSLTFDDLVYVPRARVSDDQRLIAGDIVIASSSGSKEIVGKAGQLINGSFSGSFGGFCTVVRPDTALSASFIGYYFQSPGYRKAVSDLSAGSNINNIKSSDLAQHLIPIAPRAEQTRIVAKLEELLSDLDAAVAELKAAQAKLQQYRQSLLKAAVEGALTQAWREANPTPEETGADLLARILAERRARWEAQQLAKFEAQGKKPPKDWRDNYPAPVRPEFDGLPTLPAEWAWASLEEVAADERYSLAIGPFGSNLTVPDYRDEGVPLVFVRNIRSGQFGGTSTRYVTAEKARELIAHEVAPGDVLVTKMGEPPGDACVYPPGLPLAIITADCIKVRCQHGLLLPGFLAAVVNSHIGRSQIQPMTQGVAQKKVSLGRFSKFSVPLPSLEEQSAILEKLQAAEFEARCLTAAIERSLQQSTAQRQNLLRSAFAGQLVPQDPWDEPASELLARIRAERAQQAPVKRRGRRTGTA